MACWHFALAMIPKFRFSFLKISNAIRYRLLLRIGKTANRMVDIALHNNRVVILFLTMKGDILGNIIEVSIIVVDHASRKQLLEN